MPGFFTSTCIVHSAYSISVKHVDDTNYTNCGGGGGMYSSLSTFNTTIEVPLSKAPNPQLLPGRRSINGCPLLRVCVHGVCVFTAVCVHLGCDKCRARSMGHHTWSYVTSPSLSTVWGGEPKLNRSLYRLLHPGRRSKWVCEFVYRMLLSLLQTPI